MDADPLHALQRAARRCGGHISPGSQITRVVIFDAGGRKVCDLVIPAEMLPPPPSEVKPEPPDVKPGWDVDERRALYDGERVAVAKSRLKLLSVFVDADGPLSARELAPLAFDRQTSDDNVVYHVNQLRKELVAVFPDFEGEIISGAKGYQLQVR